MTSLPQPPLVTLSWWCGPILCDVLTAVSPVTARPAYNCRFSVSGRLPAAWRQPLAT